MFSMALPEGQRSAARVAAQANDVGRAAGDQHQRRRRGRGFGGGAGVRVVSAVDAAAQP